jgi:hypothetical protein
VSEHGTHAAAALLTSNRLADMPSDITDIIAERELGIAGDPSARVTVRIGRPYRRATGEWACPFQFVGLSASGCTAAYGEDGVQALQLGLEMIRILLAASGKDLVWNEEGFPPAEAGGFMRTLLLPREFAGPVHEMIDRASEEWRKQRDEASDDVS